jgi:hypothetical protein
MTELKDAFGQRDLHAQLERLPDTAHAPTIERREAFDQLVTPFLAEIFGADVVATTAEERAGIGSTAPST